MQLFMFFKVLFWLFIKKKKKRFCFENFKKTFKMGKKRKSDMIDFFIMINSVFIVFCPPTPL